MGGNWFGRWKEEKRKRLTRRGTEVRIVPSACRARTMRSVGILHVVYN
jgi:hypothetical protein